jgi:1-acyl-sn-glycerol-3-phosphate acyltransferase
MVRWLSKFIYFKILGWQVTGNTTFSKDTIKKAVLIAAPHTSWHDFYIGLLLRGVVGIKSHFIGKKELFVGPLGWYLRWVGGSPVDRTSGQNKVQAIAQLFENKDEFRLALAPEGTRKKVNEWKTGFYYIALEAKVPIIMFTLDFKNKTNNVSEPFFATGNIEEDFKFMRKFYKNVVGKIPKYS